MSPSLARLLPILTCLFCVVPVRESAALVSIHDIQGSGSSVAITTPVEISAIVVGDFQAVDQLKGFFLQEEDPDVDASPATSEGIFVYCNTCPVGVSVGDLVLVSGIPSDVADMSQITATAAGDVLIASTGNPLPTSTVVSLAQPLRTAASYEAFEGMLVTVSGALSVADNSNLDRYGELLLTLGRFIQFTQENAPSAAGYAAHLDDLSRSSLILDDDDSIQNAALVTSDTTVFHPLPAFSTTNFVRSGDTITNLTGVLHWSTSGAAGTNAWRIRPVIGAFSYAFSQSNPRPAAPPPLAGGTRMGLVHLVNYFTTLDTGPSVCGPSGIDPCRGANSAAELTRQTQKTVATICALDADVIALVSLENAAAAGDVVASLASSINAAGGAGCPGPYSAVGVEPLGADTIKVGLIYRADRVTPQGAPAVLDTVAFVDPISSGRLLNRPALAQTFVDGGGEKFTVVVNHWKSKGCGSAAGADLDQLDGQQCYASTRTLTANTLASWIATDPTGSNDEDFLVVGDLASHALEDPIQVLENAGYSNLVETHLGPTAYSSALDGQSAYLDHALASPSLAAKVEGVVEWHINSDEADLLDYNDLVQDPGEASFEVKPSGTPLFDGMSPARSSDRDPLLIVLPEPSPIALLAPGLLGLVALTRRRASGRCEDRAPASPKGAPNGASRRNGRERRCGKD